MKNEKPQMNPEVGNTIPMKSSEQLVAEGPATGHAVVPGAIGKSFAEIAREKSIEYKPGTVETIPETVSLDRLKSDAISPASMGSTNRYDPLRSSR